MQPSTLITTVKSTSKGRKGNVYEIRRGGDGQTYCTCPGWKYHGHCRHLEAHQTAQEELAEQFS